MRLWLAVAGVVVALASPAAAQEGHAGYYYPEPQSREDYVSRARTMIDSDRSRRLQFTQSLTMGQLERPFPPSFAIFAKGDEAEKLIIVSMNAGYADTLFRMRGFLALLTHVARESPLFTSFKVEEIFTFLDLLKLLGFQQLTVTDGDRYAHQILIK
ncbi:MAG: molybdopterin-guanine dinucleotide biosynthesis protein A [Alphaproteobacteria bacterium]|nr:molybdopterin-guanine dinucleotide biosynthesis protein A [Alphaproteobacteria bacterium]